MERKFGIGLIVVAVVGGMVFGFVHSASAGAAFWAAFVPSAWANVIGVTVAAVIGIPIGFAINHYVLRLAEERERRTRANQARELLQHVRAEVNPHSEKLLRLARLFSRGSPAPDQPLAPVPGSQTTGPSSSPEILATLFLQDVIGRRAISDRNLFEVGESLAVFEIGNYYARVGELNRLLNFRIQYATHQGAWDREISGLLATLWVAQEQVKLEIDQAIERLERRATR
jgi:hypothetical protein